MGGAPTPKWDPICFDPQRLRNLQMVSFRLRRLQAQVCGESAPVLGLRARRQEAATEGQQDGQAARRPHPLALWAAALAVSSTRNRLTFGATMVVIKVWYGSLPQSPTKPGNKRDIY